jgi:hypothetical protein
MFVDQLTEPFRCELLVFKTSLLLQILKHCYDDILIFVLDLLFLCD